MTHDAIHRERSETLLADARTQPEMTQRWLKLGIAGILGVVAGAILFPKRAEGEPIGQIGTRGRSRGGRPKV